MTGIYVDDVHVSFKRIVVLEADTIAITSTPFEVRDTVFCLLILIRDSLF